MATEGIRMSEAPEMVERVARACAEARFGTGIYWNQESDSWRQAHIDIALAAIAAMRVPTEAMLAIPVPITRAELVVIWRAMLDAALKG
jgi:hypothetical protein